MDRLNKKTTPLIICIFGFVCFAAVCMILKISPARLTGAAFCHQIPSRSPGANYPFCYRCSGLFSGITAGIITTRLWEEKRRLYTIPDILFFAFSFLFFIIDILNSSKFSGIHFYNESVNIRFLSAFPLGFFLVRIILQIINYLFSINNLGLIKNIPEKVLMFTISLGLFYYLVFSNNNSLKMISEILLTAGCITFLALLYTILCSCFSMLKNRQINKTSAFFAGLALAFFHITAAGGIHIRFLRFERFFS